MLPKAPGKFMLKLWSTSGVVARRDAIKSRSCVKSLPKVTPSGAKSDHALAPTLYENHLNTTRPALLGLVDWLIFKANNSAGVVAKLSILNCIRWINEPAGL